MKPILIIYPPYSGKLNIKSRAPFPLGPLYLTAYLEEHHIPAAVADLNFLGEGWLQKNLKNYNSIIGISSLMSTMFQNAYAVASTVKKIRPNSVIVMGGPHATAYPEHIFKNCPAVDYVCIGEGEVGFLEFVSTGMAADSIICRGCAIKKPTLFPDMDELPFIQRAHLLESPDHFKREFKELMVTFSRGCPHRCEFCSSRLIQGSRWRHKSIERIVDELSFYVTDWGVRSFIIEDDNLCPGTVGVKFLKDLCKVIYKSGLPKLRFHVPHGIPVYATADSELCDWLWTVGFRNMVFPLESTNLQVLKDMRKEFTPDNWRKGLANWSNYETLRPSEIILGYPFVETIKTMLKTIMDVAGASSIVWPSHFRPYRGLPLFDRLVEAGYVPADYDPVCCKDFYVETERFNIKDLKALRRICKGANFGTENSMDAFSVNLGQVKFPGYEFLPDNVTFLPGTIVATGKFGFKRGQEAFTEILLMRRGCTGRPIVKIKENAIIYVNTEPSRVYSALHKMLREK